jgi:hypothetical protein
VKAWRYGCRSADSRSAKRLPLLAPALPHSMLGVRRSMFDVRLFGAHGASPEPRRGDSSPRTSRGGSAVRLPPCGQPFRQATAAAGAPMRGFPVGTVRGDAEARAGPAAARAPYAPRVRSDRSDRFVRRDAQAYVQPAPGLAGNPFCIFTSAFSRRAAPRQWQRHESWVRPQPKQRRLARPRSEGILWALPFSAPLMQ